MPKVAYTKTFVINDIPEEGVEDGYVLCDWECDRVIAAIYVREGGDRYAEIDVQNNNPDYGWVGYDDVGLCTTIHNMLDLPPLTINDAGRIVWDN